MHYFFGFGVGVVSQIPDKKNPGAELGPGKAFGELSKKSRNAVLLCFFLGVCIFAGVFVSCLKFFSFGWIDFSFMNAFLAALFLVFVFIVFVLVQYHCYKLRQWQYFVGISAAILESK